MIEPAKKIADLTVAEFQTLVRSSLFSAAKVWLLLTLGIPAAVITALVVFYLVMRAMHG